MPKNAVAFEVQEGTPEAHKPGAYYFFSYKHPNTKQNYAGVVHACPCGCGGQTLLWFRGKGPEGRDQWDVTGEWPLVTLSPSIGVKYDGAGNGPMTSPYHWHGYLRNGVFEEC